MIYFLCFYIVVQVKDLAAAVILADLCKATKTRYANLSPTVRLSQSATADQRSVLRQVRSPIKLAATMARSCASKESVWDPSVWNGISTLAL